MNEMARQKRDPKTVALAQAIVDAYNPKTVEDMNDALKDIFGPMFEAMLKGEMDNHLGYDSNDKGSKNDSNRRNGYGSKLISMRQFDAYTFHIIDLCLLVIIMKKVKSEYNRPSK